MKLSTICTPEGTKRVHSVHFSTAKVEEECEIFCPSSNAKFLLIGNLVATVDKESDEKWIALPGHQGDDRW